MAKLAGDGGDGNIAMLALIEAHELLTTLVLGLQRNCDDDGQDAPAVVGVASVRWQHYAGYFRQLRLPMQIGARMPGNSSSPKE